MRYLTARNLDIVRKLIREPRRAFSKLRSGLSPDPIYSAQSQWIHGTLARIALRRLLPQSCTFDLKLIRPLDRTWMTSITAEELCCLLIVAKAVQAKKVLEIGTWDGNTSVNFAANIDGNVVTVDLPPDFDGDQHKAALTYPNADLYVTDRAQLGRQFHGHSLGPRIHQVYGDSAKIDWSTLGSPFDLIFIDGCHDFEYVASDTANARKHIAPGGAVVWHDYGMLWDVSRVVDLTAHSANELKVHAIEGTRLAVGFRVSETNTTISSHLASTQL